MKVLDVDLFQEGLQRNISMLDRLRSEIEVIHRAVEGLVQLEDQLKGEGGDAIRSFYEECHLPFLQYFQLFSEHFKQVLHQMEAALYSLEPDSAGYIVEQFLEGELEQGLTLIGQLTANLTDETNSIMDQVRDIVGLPHLDDSGVQEGVINSKRKRDDTVARLHEFDATQTTALSPIEQGIQTMETWLSDLEGLYKDGLTDIHFQTNLWASLSSNNFLKTDLSQRTTPLADLSTMTDRKNHLKTMLQLFLAGASPIRFGYGGLIKPSTLLGHNILAFSSITAPIKLSNKESMSELEMIYAELSKQPQLSNYHSDNPIDPITGDYMVTFEGKRKVMGGNGSGTPDGLAPFTIASYDFFLGDIATIVGPEATVNERIEAAAFTFLKPLKVADTGHDLLKAGENAKDAGKGIDNANEIKDLTKLTVDDIPTAKSGNFNGFFNSLTSSELDELWEDKKIRKKIERQLREPGGLHEWHLVSRAPQFKYWNISAEEIKDLRTAISDVNFVNPNGVHGGLGSTKAHNELLAIIDTSNDYNTFVRRLNNWAIYRLEGGVSSLPEGLILK
ncbi:hypothetical protein AM499_09870 [Bacillus sp. FJAT-22090]|uniref:ribonuclease YeeF family protein n=1 Tax=Bacillus sp. FJAT-22090 TaxID=1581038 RepID=UPI0006BC1666|nr:LXG domain-containing protein [Bacillus sp. FJAT-22090]ALC86095.1 hypothetical protein AM499_09870 [Bacillus sp. FJAT-22090]